MSINLMEAFKELKLLDEDIFDINAVDKSKLTDYIESDLTSDNGEDFETIIDPEAENESELSDSYIGKVILECEVCKSKIYEDAENVIINDEEGLANTGEECIYCQSPDGYKIIGEVAEYKPVTREEETTETEEEIVVSDEKDQENDELLEDRKSGLSNMDKIRKVLRMSESKRLKRNKLNDRENLKEEKKSKKYIVLDHFNPEDLYLIADIDKDSSLWDSDFYIEDVTKYKGNCLVSNDDESIEVYPMNGKTLAELDSDIYKDIEDTFKDSNEDYYENDDFIFISVDREDFEKDKDNYKHILSDLIKDSYVDGDSSSQYQVLNLDDSEFENYKESLFFDEDEDLEESLKEKNRSKKELKEDTNINIKGEADIEVDSDAKVNIEGEKEKEEMIVPVNPETEDKFEQEGNEIDIDLDEIDEVRFDELEEKYLKEVYNNVKSYKTISGKLDGNTIKLEGLITFDSGKKAKTTFTFEGKTITKRGKIKLIGENKHLAGNKDPFTLTGSLSENKKRLLIESLTYNVQARDSKTNKSKRLYGTIK